MRTAFRTTYGSPQVLSIRDVDKPIPKKNELLVRVYAATVNRTDCAILTARLFIMRLFTGLSKPKLTTTGTDFAGIVEAIGNGVTQFNVGDKVWGFDDRGLSSHAEYLTISQEKAVVTIPEGISYEQAAASAEAAHYAYNSINKVKLRAEQKALVNGATGAIGSAVVQLLKYHKVYVTAVCTATHFEKIKSLGADKLIDYTQEDFTKDAESYDFVFDAVGKSTFAQCKPLLNKSGVYISSELGPHNQNAYLPLITMFNGKRVVFPFPLSIKTSLLFIKSLIEQGNFMPLIDRTYPLEKISEAFTYVDSGQKIGNVIIKVNDQ